MKFKILSSKNYPDPSADYGDCTLIDTGSELVIYDCGSLEHAQRAEDYMQQHSYTTAIGVLSHNDRDHFNGFPYLAEQGLVTTVYTPLYWDHLTELLKLLDDDRRKRSSLETTLRETYANVSELEETYGVTVIDALTNDLPVSGVEIVGPFRDYALAAAVQGIKATNPGDKISHESFQNAASVQVSFRIGNRRVLLCGDSAFEPLKDQLLNHSVLQLPHHGTLDTAEKIFDVRDQLNDTVYLISDNKGSAAGGSDKLMEKYPYGRCIHNTRSGDLAFPELLYTLSGNYTGHTYAGR